MALDTIKNDYLRAIETEIAGGLQRWAELRDRWPQAGVIGVSDLPDFLECLKVQVRDQWRSECRGLAAFYRDRVLHTHGLLIMHRASDESSVLEGPRLLEMVGAIL